MIGSTPPWRQSGRFFPNGRFSQSMAFKPITQTMFICRHNLFFAALFLPLGALAQLTENPGEEDPTVTRDKLVKWVEIQKLISKESAEWEEQKAILSNLIELRKGEIAEFDEVIDLARDRVETVEQRNAELEGQLDAAQDWRKGFEVRVTRIEDALIPQLDLLPGVLIERIEGAVERLRDRNDDGDLQARFRDVLAILNECVAFNSDLHLTSEIREIEGSRVEVEILYLGLSQAWYVDRTNSRAGTGVPGSGGWVWTEDTRIASQVRKAVDILSRRETPAFARLPVRKGQFD